MRAAFVNGKYVPPSSAGAGRLRHQQLTYEIGRIEQQIADLPRRAELERRDPKWCDKARRCQGHLMNELRSLEAWLADCEKLPSAEDYAKFWEG
jgi:hypothetical protein